jgi:putative DNA primase/helicase
MDDPALLAVAELRSIVTLAQEGTSKGELISRLYTVCLTGSTEEVMALRMLAAVKGWASEVKEYQKTQRPANKAPHLRIVEPDMFVGPDLADGLPDAWENPTGYTCTNAGVFVSGEKGQTRVCARPIWIGARWSDVDTGDHLVQVDWHGGCDVIHRSAAMNTKEIISIAGKGAPVSSVNARGVVQWLQAAEEVNADIIPLHTSISRVGWTKKNEKHLIQGADGPHLLRAEEGHKQTMRSLKPSGTWQHWLKAAGVVNRHPVAALMLAASVASILLEPMEAAPFVVDLHGHSSRGKTTALRWAASAWADPSDGGAYILPWSATPAALEGRAGWLQDYPVMVDDTKKIPVKDRDKMLSIVMGWGSGQGKARGAVRGVQTVATWKSVMLSTGEASLAKLGGENVGMRLRIVPISAQPFPDNAEAVRVIESLDHWGHLAPRIEAWAQKHWGDLPEMWQVNREAIERTINKGPSGNRMAGYLASITIAMQALGDIGVPMPAKEMTDLMIAAANTALASSDTTTEAWERITAWLVSNHGRISDQTVKYDSHGAKIPELPPPTGWIGRAKTDGTVAVSPPILDAELRRMGYDPEEILPLWAKADRLVKDGERMTVTTKWQGKGVRMYVLQGLDGWDSKTD